MRPKQQLYMWSDRFVWGAPEVGDIQSARFTATILASETPYELSLELDNGSLLKGHAFILAPNVSHLIQSDGPFLSINFIPSTYEYFQILNLLDGKKTLSIDLEEMELWPRLRELRAGELDCAEAMKATCELCTALSPSPVEMPRTDLRVLAVMRRLRLELPYAPDVSELAAFVGVSSDWLGHMFTEQVGISMKSYLVWAKMQRAALLLQRGQNLTQIAIDTGFADPAHLTRTFRRFCGVSPSSITDRELVTHHHCELG